MSLRFYTSIPTHLSTLLNAKMYIITLTLAFLLSTALAAPQSLQTPTATPTPTAVPSTCAPYANLADCIVNACDAPGVGDSIVWYVFFFLK